VPRGCGVDDHALQAPARAIAASRSTAKTWDPLVMGL
jgi:hypothetical protein